MVGAIEGLEKIRVVNLFSLVAREERSGPRSRRDRGWCDRDHHLCYPRLDLSFFQGRGRKAAIVSRPGDLAEVNVRPLATAAEAGMMTILIVW